MTKKSETEPTGGSAPGPIPQKADGPPPNVEAATPNLLAAARIRTEITPRVAMKKKVVHVPCRRPSKSAFVRTNPDNHADFWLLEGADEQTYVVHPDVALELGDLVRPKRLIPTIDREGNLSLWPIKLSDSDGRIDSWNQSAMELAFQARDHWLRLQSNRSAGCYEAMVAMAAYGEPDWPEMTMDEMVNLAFRDKYIDRMDHPVVLRLMGKA